MPRTSEYRLITPKKPLTIPLRQYLLDKYAAEPSTSLTVPNRGGSGSTCFLDLPAELRNTIYKLALSKVRIHLLPPGKKHDRPSHGLIRTSKQVRNDVLPLYYAICPIEAVVNDLDFSGLLEWEQKLSLHADDERALRKNQSLTIRLCMTKLWDKNKNFSPLNKWLHRRADSCRPQFAWVYKSSSGTMKVYDLTHKAKRCTNENKQKEMIKILEAFGATTAAITFKGRTPPKSRSVSDFSSERSEPPETIEQISTEQGAVLGSDGQPFERQAVSQQAAEGVPARTNNTSTSQRYDRWFPQRSETVSRHRLQDYQIQLMVLEQQRQKRLSMESKANSSGQAADTMDPSIAGSAAHVSLQRDMAPVAMEVDGSGEC